MTRKEIFIRAYPDFDLTGFIEIDRKYEMLDDISAVEYIVYENEKGYVIRVMFFKKQGERLVSAKEIYFFITLKEAKFSLLYPRV